MSRASRFAVLFSLLFAAPLVFAQDRETKVRNDRKNVEADENWIYNDLPKGISEARKTGKPMLVVFRCVPCEACAQLDSQLVSRDPVVRELMDKFVCVRIVHANGMDLSLFQFDYDQSLSAFLMNADMTIYGRYGTRSHQTESEEDVSVEGFGKALSAALELHKQFPAIKSSLAAKRGPDSAIKVPEEFPSLKGKFTAKLDYDGNVVKSCIHCHQVGEAIRRVARADGKIIPEKILYPYPNPKSLGLIMDPREKATVKSVTASSPGEKDGFRAGDEIVSLEGQPMLSIADVQWVLHNAGVTAVLKADVVRNGEKMTLPITLAKGWRERSDISWRTTTWELRRMAFGGMVLEDLPAADRAAAGIADKDLALRVKYVGQYGDHARAKQAGFVKGDIVVSVDGKTQAQTETTLVTRLANTKKPGDRVTMNILRDGKPHTLTINLPEVP